MQANRRSSRSCGRATAIGRRGGKGKIVHDLAMEDLAMEDLAMEAATAAGRTDSGKSVYAGVIRNAGNKLPVSISSISTEKAG